MVTGPATYIPMAKQTINKVDFLSSSKKEARNSSCSKAVSVSRI